MNIRINKSDVLFYLAFVIYYVSLFIVYLPLENTDTPKKLLAVLACLCLIINLLPSLVYKIPIKKKHILLITIILGLLSLSLALKDLFIVIIILFGLNIYFQVKDITPVFKLSFMLLTGLTVMVVLLSFFGVLDQNVTYSVNGFRRYSLGFYHSNVPSLILFYLALYYFIFKRNITVASFMIFELLEIIVYLICRSRNIFFSLQFFLLFSVFTKFMKNSRKYRKLLEIVCVIIAPIMAGISLGLLYLYSHGSQFAESCNDIFNNRIMMADLYYHYQDFKIINIMSPDNYKIIALTLDNGYYYTTARYGVAFLFFIFAAAYYFMKYASKQKNTYALLALIFACVSSFIDNSFYSFLFFPFIIIALYGFIHINGDNTKKCCLRRSMRLLIN